MPSASAPSWSARAWRSGDGLALHARDYPPAAGPARLPVVCLHGLTRNSRDFDTLAPWIAARGRRVLAVDVRGRGRSAHDPAADYRLPAYADDIVRLLDTLGLPRALFVGTSMGGLIAMELAASHPGLVAGAVVNDVGPVLGAAGLARIGGYVGQVGPFPSRAAAAAHLARQNGAALPNHGPADWEQMAERLFHQDDRGWTAAYDPAIAQPFADAPLPGDPWDRWHALADGTRPVLLLRGALSDLLEPAVAARMAMAPRVILREIPAVGHAPMLDEPAALAALDAFLADSD